MKQELVIPFSLRALLAAETVLTENPELELTVMSMSYMGYNDALACYDYSRTMDVLDRLKVIFCNERITIPTLVAAAGLPIENRIAMKHVSYKQEKLTTAGYGNQTDMASSRESFGQLKTAITGILMAAYDFKQEDLEEEGKMMLAIDTGFFTPYVTTPLTLVDDGEKVADEDAFVEDNEESSLIEPEGDF